MPMNSDDEFIMRVHMSQIIHYLTMLTVISFITEYVFKQVMIATDAQLITGEAICCKVKQVIYCLIIKSCCCAYGSTNTILNVLAIGIVIVVSIFIPHCQQYTSNRVQAFRIPQQESPHPQETLLPFWCRQ